MRNRLTIYEQTVTLIVNPNKKNGGNKMLESLKKKTLLGNLWCIIVLGIVTAALGVVFGPGMSRWTTTRTSSPCRDNISRWTSIP